MEDFLSSRSRIQSVMGLHCTNVVEASQGNDKNLDKHIPQGLFGLHM